MDDLVSTTGQAFLGLTLGCARCHDHKFDPIPTRDYYRMVRAFANVKRWNTPPVEAIRERDIRVAISKRKLYEEKLAALDCTEDERKWLSVDGIMGNESRKAHEKYDPVLKFTDKEWRATLSPEDRKILARLESAVAKSKPGPDWAAKPALFVKDISENPKPVPLLKRGDVSLPEGVVDLGFLSVLTGEKSAQQFLKEKQNDIPDGTTGQRAALAAWLTDTEAGAGHLLARVAVNRIWQGYFGRGLVRSANDFGLQGDSPTHPELLDWLAGELIRNDWKMKPVHRLILTSRTYQQSSAYDETRHAVDPTNELLWRREPKRLSAEAIRDAVLAVSGRLNSKPFGPGIRPFIPTDAIATRSGHKWPEDVEEGPEEWRRSVYIFAKRSVRFPMLENFDSPDPTMSCGRRIPTTVPIQSLSMLNNPFVRSSAQAFSKRVSASAKTPEQQITEAYRTALGRAPVESELFRSLTFLENSESEKGLTDLCHTLFTLNEFIYIE